MNILLLILPGHLNHLLKKKIGGMGDIVCLRMAAHDIGEELLGAQFQNVVGGQPLFPIPGAEKKRGLGKGEIVFHAQIELINPRGQFLALQEFLGQQRCVLPKKGGRS